MLLQENSLIFQPLRLFLFARMWDVSPTTCNAKLQLVYGLKISKTVTLDIKHFACTCIVCMDGGYSQGGQPASKGAPPPPPPPNEWVKDYSELYAVDIMPFTYMYMGVYNRWTGLVDWTSGLDYWTDRFSFKMHGDAP